MKINKWKISYSYYLVTKRLTHKLVFYSLLKRILFEIIWNLNIINYENIISNLSNLKILFEIIIDDNVIWN